ncbi:hypothetical protein A2Z33_04570 [Candidatus Gottesmanbacteria bacterium RBG_16_52_11]|uniref:Aspartyl/glutamyl-tRNA(Asn/Gln) amidotransferase subunit C n=1 Tax=Candidatus Gottesmanbacteria bacterium RBG_16_52_11 TaxID=1798374 RepID=A0A1F5YV81_9BACT|nr:MAG: hypothetical protein A2Z33_04570 [Candidatus Gottesmanbacteria bacterium RBG_16_52_11]
MAGLANIPVSPGEETDLADGFNATIAVVDQLFALDTSGTEPTHQVTDLENVMREDEVDSDRTFSQEDALKNAVRTYNGYFVVDRIIP